MCEESAFRRNETHLKVSNSFSLQYSKMILLLVSVNLSVLDFKLESLGMRLTRLEEWLVVWSTIITAK